MSTSKKGLLSAYKKEWHPFNPNCILVPKSQVTLDFDATNTFLFNPFIQYFQKAKAPLILGLIHMYALLPVAVSSKAKAVPSFK